MDQSFEQFKERLDDTYQWPATYTFKFVVPQQKKGSLLSLVPMGDISERASSSGKYVSLTIKSRMNSSDQVVDAYKKVSALEGVITL